jgi:hypothetical protein
LEQGQIGWAKAAIEIEGNMGDTYPPLIGQAYRRAYII